jgi:hypothetical protein
MYTSVDKNGKYIGPERRHKPRRQNGDRRDLLRFEPDKADRRDGDDRRADSGWHTNTIA